MDKFEISEHVWQSELEREHVRVLIIVSLVGGYTMDSLKGRTWSKINPYFVIFSMSCTKATMKRCKIVVPKIQAGCYKFNKFDKN